MPAYVPREVPEVRCPVLLIDGEKSPDIFRRTANALQTWLPDARRETVGGASHGMNVSNAGAFNRIVRAFVGA